MVELRWIDFMCVSIHFDFVPRISFDSGGLTRPLRETIFVLYFSLVCVVLNEECAPLTVTSGPKVMICSVRCTFQSYRTACIPNRKAAVGRGSVGREDQSEGSPCLFPSCWACSRRTEPRRRRKKSKEPKGTGSPISFSSFWLNPKWD